MNIANVRAHYSLQPIDRQHGSPSTITTNTTGYDRNQAFYDKSMTVLFDLPNCVVVSTYVLLTLVWAECFLESRFHTESISQWKNVWLKLYMWFNSALYGCQLVLYCSIFLATDSIVRTVLYAVLTGINFVAVSMVTASCHISTFAFQASPSASQAFERFLEQNIIRHDTVVCCNACHLGRGDSVCFFVRR
jgi:hypothetical protein